MAPATTVLQEPKAIQAVLLFLEAYRGQVAQALAVQALSVVALLLLGVHSGQAVQAVQAAQALVALALLLLEAHRGPTVQAVAVEALHLSAQELFLRQEACLSLRTRWESPPWSRRQSRTGSIPCRWLWIEPGTSQEADRLRDVLGAETAGSEHS